MPRRKRGWIDNACYHITHRCHNKEFLFHYKKYRRYYVRHLFLMSKRYNIEVLNFVVTSNHVHLLLVAKKSERISDGLRYLHGRVAQWCNLELKSSGSFWSDRFHSTLIQDGAHLGKCLFYIDLNMVRAGVVRHPSEWDSCGYGEFYNPKQRCGIVNMPRLLRVLDIPDVENFRKWHTLTLDELIRKRDNARKDFWSRAFAVGDPDWLRERLRESGRKRMKVMETGDVSFAIGKTV